LELRHLRYFLAVAETLHFGRAAQRLRIAQPSLSHQILQLESELNSSLFERSSKGVRLTESGVLFLEETRQILQHVDRAALTARTGKRIGTERLRVGFGHWINMANVCAAIKRFDESHPNVHVELYSMSVPEQITALREHRLDVGFVRPPVTDPLLQSEFLTAEPFMVAMSQNHRLAKERRVRLSDLKGEPIIMPVGESLPFFYGHTLKLFHDAGFVPNVHDEVDYPAMVLGLAATGIGVTLVPASIRKIQSSGLVFLPLQPSSRVLETAMAWCRDGTSARLGAFLQIIRDVVAPHKRRTRPNLQEKVKEFRVSNTPKRNHKASVRRRSS
jgi:DNA-binding transcriptional LysR family regulator